MINFEIAKFMLDFDKNKLPIYFNECFCKISQVHIYRTNHLQRSIKFRGVNIWNKLPNFLKNTPYHKFRYLYKRHILESYQQSNEHWLSAFSFPFLFFFPILEN